MGTGEWLALGCALNWAFAVICFKKLNTRVDPLEVNVFKNGLGLLLLIPTVYAVEGRFFIPVAQEYLWTAFLSGFLGIGVADGLFLIALRKIEASQMAFVDCLYAPFVVLLSYIFFAEQLTWLQYLGGALIVSAVVFAHTRPVKPSGTPVLLSAAPVILSGSEGSPGIFRVIHHYSGAFIGAAAILMMAFGVSILKPLFSKIPLFYLIELRIIAGFLFSTLVILVVRPSTKPLNTLRTSHQKGFIFLGSFFATYVSMICWVAGFKYSNAAIVAVLNQTSSVFTILLAAYFLNEKLTGKKIFAALLAFTGVVIINL